MGFLISLEGPDGCGKSTQIGYMKDFFANEGYEVECVLRGLGENEAIRSIYIDHAKAAMESIQ